MKNVEYRTSPFGWDLCTAGVYGCGSGNPGGLSAQQEAETGKAV